MHVALYPSQPSPGLVEALRHAGLEPVPVADAAAVAETEPAAGWAATIIELGGDPTAGLAVARRLESENMAPVLVVAGRAQAAQLADAEYHDFILEPVDPIELAVRVRRLAGAGQETTEKVTFKDLTLNLATYQATLGTAPIDLTFMEYELLRFFATHPGRVWSREQLLSRVWGYDYFGGARTVDVHVRRLRAKLGEERASWISTVRSVGYRFG